MQDLNHETEVLVIGAVPGGYAAAFRAADLGLDVTLVDLDKRPGGECLFRGCIPSKTLLSLAELLYDSQRSEAMGIRFDKPVIDLEKIRVDRDVTALAARFFAPQEQGAIAHAGPTARYWTFSRIWVAKEAVLKAQGSGLTFPLDRHCIELFDNGTACRLVSEGSPPDSAPPTIQFLPLEEGWVGAVAAEGSGWRVTLCT